MNCFDLNAIERIIQAGIDEQNNPEIMGVIYSLGRDAQNEEEYEYSYHKILRLYHLGTPGVRAYCVLGLSMMAIYHKKLDESVISIIEKELTQAEGKNLSIVKDAVEDINFAMGWNIRIPNESI